MIQLMINMLAHTSFKRCASLLSAFYLYDKYVLWILLYKKVELERTTDNLQIARQIINVPKNH